LNSSSPNFYKWLKLDFLKTKLTESTQHSALPLCDECVSPLFLALESRYFLSKINGMKYSFDLGVNFWSRNYVGTIFGGSMFSATDPFYMIMLHRILGKEYVVWDKSATIRFKRPGSEKIYARLILTPDFIEKVKSEVQEKGEMTYELKVNWVNKNEKVIAEIDRTLYVANQIFL
jgi:acyl-coenzyme A thioesterase PaaI-like protein